MKKITSLIMMLLVVIGASGQKISAVKALEKAQAFAQKLEGNKSKGQSVKTVTLKRLAQREVLNGTDGNELFMYNIGDGDGFVIVSGDERVPEILGYSDIGSINPKDMPENMRWWLQMYADEIKHLEGTKMSKAVAKHPAIAPMLTCTWNQGAPYNGMCPMDNGRGKLSYTGCVATAMAQALTAVRPANISAIDGYTKTYHNNTATLENLPATTINWSILRDKYNSDENDASAQEVAKLMRYCGQAANMGYSAAASGTSSEAACRALKQYFGITNECKNIYRINYDKTGWDNYIYRELSNGRVVMLGGGNFDAGHEFVCDGYDGDGLYHINWGWGGKSNSYFEINHLNPDDQGIGGSNGGYSTGVDAIVNLRVASPDEQMIYVPTTYQWVSKPETVNRTAKTEPFKIDLTMLFVNFNEEYEGFDVCWSLYDSSDLLIEKTDKKSFSRGKGYGENISFTCNFGANLGDGKYYIKALGHQQGATNWGECNYQDVGTLIMTIKGNQATLTELPGKTNPSFKFSDMSIESHPIVGIPTPLNVTVENTGSTYSSEIFVIVDGKAVTSIAANIDPGEKETFGINLTFEDRGQKEIWMARQEYDKNINDYKYIQISSKVTCTAVAEQICPVKISNFKVKNYSKYANEVYTIGSTSCTISADVTNNSGSSYISSIGFHQAEYTSATGISFYTKPDAEVAVNIPSGTTKTVEYTFTNLDESIKYRFLANYKTGANTWAAKDWWNDNVAADVVIDLTTGIDNVSVSNTDSDEPIYSLDGRRIATPQHGIYIRGGKKYVK